MVTMHLDHKIVGKGTKYKGTSKIRMLMFYRAILVPVLIWILNCLESEFLFCLLETQT